MSHISCCATVSSDRQLWTCFDGGEPAGPHIDLSGWWASANHDLLSLAPSVAPGSQTRARWAWSAAAQQNEELLFSHVIKPIAKSIIITKHSMHMVVSQKPLEKINIPQRKCRLFRMSSVTHSHWAICNSHFGFEGSWALNREEFPFEGRICWNRPMIISILMAL